MSWRLKSLCLVLLLPIGALGQSDRILQPLEFGHRTILSQGLNSRAQPQHDQGSLDPAEPVRGMTLMLKNDPIQTAALAQFVEEQQDSQSPNYHRWLTPEEYADRFGLSANDLSRVISWLLSEGFTVDYIARGRNFVVFSGSAVQVQHAFETNLHRYLIDGVFHYANTRAPSVPSALRPAIEMVSGLDSFRPRPPRPPTVPQFTGADGNHSLVPGDIAAIYNINALYQLGMNGTGVTIAVAGQTAVNLSDITVFRSQYGLTRNDPQVTLVPGYPDPGVRPDDLLEADVDIEYAGAIAPSAKVQYVYSPNVFTSAFYAIAQNLAPIITFSYGVCEPDVSSGTASALLLAAYALQANAQGITWLAASGDQGPAACDFSGQTASQGPAVSLPASIPQVTAVGGTQFSDVSGNYWSSTNAANGSSALGYIPEAAWNETTLSVAVGSGLAATGGGPSMFYSKPAWQTGLGVPSDGARDVPDLALAAAVFHDGFYAEGGGKLISGGGTSISAPIFAGVVALLNQYLISHGVLAKAGLGNINPSLYRIAQTQLGVFHDITAGNNIVPCTSGSPSCVNGQLGYSAGPGYDLTSGLGSADMYKLVTQWNSQPLITTTTSVSANPASFTVNGTTVLTATVKANSGTTTPVGTIAFSLGQNSLGTGTLAGSGGVATATLIVFGSQLNIGANTISVTYGGSNAFSSSSSAVSITVTVPTAASAVIPSVVPNPIYQQDANSQGYSWFYTVRLSEIAGIATNLTAFSIDGTDHTGDITSWFGSVTIPAHGTLSAAIESRGLTVPVNRVFSFSGIDVGGQKWTQQVSVPFYGKQTSASMALTSSPGSEIQNPSGDPRCPADYPYYQQLNLQEQNGYGVNLTRFLDGGTDDSNAIPLWFGSWRLAPHGTLQANICWKIGSAPTTLSYEVDGTDTAGNKIVASTRVPFQAPGQNAGPLSASRSSIALSAGSAQSTNTTISVKVPAGQQWNVTVFPANQRTSWLVVFPVSGTGSSQVNLVASAAGLSNGAYQATLVFQSVNTIPQFINVPLTFSVGISSNVSITGMANAASFQQAFAPGMILSVFGKNLANSTQQAPGTPLPLNLGGVSVTINGLPAPLYYVSPTQLNIQIPYETPARSSLLAVNNNGQVATSTLNVSTSSPGIFASGGSLVPTANVSPGQGVVLFLTGEGEVTPIVATGAPPSGQALSQPPQPRLPLTLTVAGIQVTPLFVGVPSWSVGVTQVNFVVPPAASLGIQPVVVKVGDTASSAVNLNIRAGTANVQFTFNPPSVNQASDGNWHYSTQLKETNGVGVTFNKLVVFSNDYTDQIANWFGSTRLAANGTLSGSFLASCSCSPPWDGTWQITGKDDSSNTNTWSGVVHFVSSAGSNFLPSAARAPEEGSKDWSLDRLSPEGLGPGRSLSLQKYGGSDGGSVGKWQPLLFDLLLNSGAIPNAESSLRTNAKGDKSIN